jgi:hypothetical protein
MACAGAAMNLNGFMNRKMNRYYKHFRERPTAMLPPSDQQAHAAGV